MQCAKCHNHPFNSWTQNDYHELAACFARVQYKILSNNRRDKLDKHEFIGEQEVYLDDVSEVKHPVTGALLQPQLHAGGHCPHVADLEIEDHEVRFVVDHLRQHQLAGPDHPDPVARVAENASDLVDHPGRVGGEDDVGHGTNLPGAAGSIHG